MVINSSTRQTGLQTLRGTSSTFFVIFFSFSTHAMGDRPEVDPQCFASDKLRVEIGDEKYEFPRKMVISMRGDNVVDVPYNDGSKSAAGDTACQKPEDNIWKLDSLILHIVPKECTDKKDCNENRISLDIHDVKYSKSMGIEGSVFTNNKEELLAKCVPPREPYNEWHRKVWSACDYAFETSQIYMRVRFRGGIYPPEKIDQTVQLVLKEIQKYEIKN